MPLQFEASTSHSALLALKRVSELLGQTPRACCFEHVCSRNYVLKVNTHTNRQNAFNNNNKTCFVCAYFVEKRRARLAAVSSIVTPGELVASATDALTMPLEASLSTTTW